MLEIDRQHILSRNKSDEMLSAVTKRESVLVDLRNIGYSIRMKPVTIYDF